MTKREGLSLIQERYLLMNGITVMTIRYPL